MTATPDERFDAEALRWQEHLCEAALRLLAALGPEPRFPEDVADVEALVGRVAQGRPGEPMEFKVEPAGELPRYDAEFQFWLSPVADGCLRVRHESGKLRSEAVVLRPDGTLGRLETIEGFGVPEGEWTEQARADVETVEQYERTMAVEVPEAEHKFEQDQLRFRTTNLLGTRAAPPQDEGGPVVTFLALHTTGVVVHYLVPRPPDEELESDDPWAEPLSAAALPKIELADGLGTSYELADLDEGNGNEPLIRASQSFTPAVPADATRLSVSFESASVEIELGER
jgi:hypothetical protein